MKQKPDWIERRQSLRTEAEKILHGVSKTQADSRPTEVLMHELLVHKVELEMQIEELQRTSGMIEEARDRYFDLYDASPMGAGAIAGDGRIQEINLAGAEILGFPRAELLTQHIAKFVSPLDLVRWTQLFQRMTGPSECDSASLVLELLRAGTTPFLAHVSCRGMQPIGEPALLGFSLIDMNKIRMAEADMAFSRKAGPGFPLH